MNTQIKDGSPTSGALAKFHRSVLVEERTARTIERVGATMISNFTLIRDEALRRARGTNFKDIDGECGYKVTLETEDFGQYYDRFGLATRVVTMYPVETWKEFPEILENSSGNYTSWEEELRKLNRRLNLYRTFLTADILCGIGNFGIIILGINDGFELDKPVAGFTDSFPEDPTGKTSRALKRQLSYLRPLSQRVVTVSEWVRDTNSPRYGQPKMYTVSTQTSEAAESKATDQGPSDKTYNVHWSRVIHIVDTPGDNLISGPSRMQDVFDYLYNLKKIVAGSGEMFFKGGFPGLSVETHPNSENVSFTPDELEVVKDQVEGYMNGLQRYMATAGMTVKSLTPQVADPSNHFDINVKAICATKGYPMRIFMGTEEAQLAGEQDKISWAERLQARRLTFVDPCIIRATIDRLMMYGVIEYKEDYSVDWPPILRPSPDETAKTALSTTQAIAAYISGNVDGIMNELDFLTEVLKIPTERAKDILANAPGLEQARQAQADAAAEALAREQEITNPPGADDEEEADPSIKK